jgi:hypothetical protein
MNKKVSIYDCSIVEMQRIHSRAGSITPVTSSETVPFEIKRVFYIYDIPGGEDRGAHAHIKCHQFLIAASGAFEIILNDGSNTRTVMLNRPYYGLHIPPGIWSSEKGFSSGSVCLVLASQKYSEQDYIRNYDKYLEWKNDSSNS